MKNKIIIMLLGLLGFATGCKQDVSEYGSPYSTFTVKGTVTDAQGNPIEGIRTSIIPTSQKAITDKLGAYSISGRNNWGSKFELTFTDIDGPENGGEFSEKTIEVDFTSADKVGEGSGWYSGDFAKTVDVTLDPKDE